MTSEIWKDVVGYEGLYKVSSIGRVKSLDRYKLWRGNANVKVKEKILKNGTDNSGYYGVVLNKESKSTTWKNHKLVAITFLNHKPNGTELVVNHINFNKKDNSIDNLEIVSMRENANRKHLKSSSKYVGVDFKNKAKKWRARIVINKKQKYLGMYDNEIDASNAYQRELNIINNQLNK